MVLLHAGGSGTVAHGLFGLVRRSTVPAKHAAELLLRVLVGACGSFRLCGLAVPFTFALATVGIGDIQPETPLLRYLVPVQALLDGLTAFLEQLRRDFVGHRESDVPTLVALAEDHQKQPHARGGRSAHWRTHLVMVRRQPMDSGQKARSSRLLS